MILIFFLILILSYLVGSIPSGFLLARWYGINDIRSHGSGSTGATNVARILGAHAFFVVFALDACKACLWIYLVQIYAPAEIFAGSLGLLLGNGFSIFLLGRSGKSIATSFGILAMLHPLLLMWAACIWLTVLLVTRIIGIASIIVLLFLPFIARMMLHDATLIFCMAAWGLLLHRDNIRDCVRKLSIS